MKHNNVHLDVTYEIAVFALRVLLPNEKYTLLQLKHEDYVDRSLIAPMNVKVWECSLRKALSLPGPST